MYKEVIKHEIMNFLDDIKIQIIPKVEDVLDTLKEKTIFIYGAGSFGKEMFNVLKNQGINIQAFLDVKASKGDTLNGVPVYNAEDPCLNSSLKNDAVVLFSIVIKSSERKVIYEYIRSCGFKNIINAQSIRCRFVRADNYPYENIGLDYIGVHKTNIIECSNLWEDQESDEIYKTNLIAHITRDYDHCLESEDHSQYFLEKFTFMKGFSRFIDCGGYTGDTLTELVKSQGKIKAAVSFEPNNESFKRLSQTADKLRQNIKELYLFPCGVSDKTELTSFNISGGSSAVSVDGETYIQCIALDNVLKGFAPTFLKMDIEGKEYDALTGAQDMIKEYKPDLAISLYHNINHLWEIPLLINSWNLGYKFYLRAHNACTMETVMYAVSDNF